ncbi:MAG: hypothetical protein K2G67_02935 [Muribaculaceae bacterium]|nr:hypothetical protein [Muribaculaceae bacterium]
MTAGFLSLFKSSKKPCTPASGSYTSPYSDMMRKVTAAHADCTAEVFNVFVSGAGKVRVFSELAPGDRVELRLRDGAVSVYAGGKYISAPLLPDSSRLRHLLESGAEVEAFLGGRDVASCTDDAEFCSIIAFYRMEGVPPTKVAVN